MAAAEVEQREAGIAKMVEARLGERAAELPQGFRVLITRAATEAEGMQRLLDAIAARLISRD